MIDAQQKPAAPSPPMKVRQKRSPAFPFISLEKALERANTFRIAEGGTPRHFAPLSAAAAAWSMGIKTGPFLQTVAALGHYELVEFQGGGENRTLRLTDAARRILLDSQPISPERDSLIQAAALAPKIHTELWEKWKDGLPSNATLETYLIRDREFSASGARDLIAVYKETIAFSKLGQPAIIPAAQNGQVGRGGLEGTIEIGDLVNAEINGALALEKPARVRAIQSHNGQPWAFIEGSETGIKIEDVRLIEKGAALPPDSPPKLPLAEIKEREPVKPGEREWLRGPLSRETAYRLIVSGEIGPKELGKLIKVLEAQKAVLDEDDLFK